MSLSTLSGLGRKLLSFTSGNMADLGFQRKVAEALNKDLDPIEFPKGLSLDDNGSIILTTQSQKSGEAPVTSEVQLATLSESRITFNEENLEKPAGTRSQIIAMLTSFCLSKEGITSINIPASYWKTSKNPFVFNERTAGRIVQSLGLTLNQVSFEIKGDTIVITKKV